MAKGVPTYLVKEGPVTSTRSMFGWEVVLSEPVVGALPIVHAGSFELVLRETVRVATRAIHVKPL